MAGLYRVFGTRKSVDRVAMEVYAEDGEAALRVAHREWKTGTSTVQWVGSTIESSLELKEWDMIRELDAEEAALYIDKEED